MISHLKKITGALLMLALFNFFSCEESEFDVTSEEYFTLGTMDSLHRNGGCGRGSCFEFVYPISLKFADGTTKSVASNEAMHAAIKAWKEANPSATQRPSLVFPLEVIAKDGTISSVANEDEFKKLLSTCPPQRGKGRGRGHRPGDRGQSCFKLNFPVSVKLPDGTVSAATDREALHKILHTWKQNNPNATTRPELVFPLGVTLADGTVKQVASKDELKALKESCGGN
jgi:hypothetical protein